MQNKFKGVNEILETDIKINQSTIENTTVSMIPDSPTSNNEIP